jgi:RNA-binding protein
MTLTHNDIKQLRAQSHHLKPVVIIGNNGLTNAVQLEIHQALEDHELIKVKIHSGDRTDRQTITQAILDEQQADLIQSIGQIIILYRKSQKHTQNKKSQ